jgi:stage V sporulation protein G
VVITEVRIKLMEDNSENERLQAFCSVTFDDAFVVRDLKIIEGTKGSFVAMPSRKLTDRCGQCGCKNHLRARYCNQCGGKLDENRATRDADGRAKLHADIAHPINSACREVIQGAVLKAFQEERERAKQPGYVCTYDDYDSDYEGSFSQVVGELNPGRNFRSHPAHSTRGAHGNGPGEVAARSTERGNQRTERSSEGFGAGIL